MGDIVGFVVDILILVVNIHRPWWTFMAWRGHFRLGDAQFRHGDAHFRLCGGILVLKRAQWGHFGAKNGSVGLFELNAHML